MDDTTGDDITVLRGRSGDRSGRAQPVPRILKQRFVLEQKLGSGGMGTVYRARDLRKVEARDANPYVAVKVLNADFQSHPDAFVALQREASKSQALSHPNIVSIYDFDKDGDLPFMTMELLEGEELSDLLKRYPHGAPAEVAWPIIEGMCQGLKRAHDAGITHSDFKPGNVYVVSDNTAKIFDFGIARAVRKHGRAGEDTLFDPASLAALTPAYASAEMLDGDTPEPRDDIYSLGVVIYLLLSGHHPYDRVRADEAARQGLQPEPLRGLTRDQWSTLARTLAFERAGRPEHVDTLLTRLVHPSPFRRPWVYAVAAGVLLSLVALLAVNTSEISEVKQTAAKDALVSAQSLRLAELLDAPRFDETWETRLGEEVDRFLSLNVDPEQRRRLLERVRETYLRRIESTADFDVAYRLAGNAARYAGGERFAAGLEVLEARLIERVETLLDIEPRDTAWLAAVELELARMANAFETSPAIAAARQEVRNVYLLAFEQAIDRGEVATAAAVYESAQRLVFDAVALDHAGAALVAAREQHQDRQQALAAAERALAVERELESTLGGVFCRSLDVAALATELDALAAAFPAHANLVRERGVGTVAGCVRELARDNRDLAASLKQRAVATFGETGALAELRFDPCAMRYLVGKGAAPGRSGFCVDEIGPEAAGPRLVVIPAPEGSVAIGKFEVSWENLAPFCVHSNGCTSTGDPTMPVTGVDVQLARDYADWLSRRTGYEYRLPTLAEWRLAQAGTTPDPNRNCTVNASGVGRGVGTIPVTSGAANALGLVNALGNAQEWVTQDGELRAAGGAYTDEIGRCVAGFVRPHNGAADSATGFRLVREVQ